VLRDSRAFKEPRVNRACRVSPVSWARLACKAFRARQDRRVSRSLETQEHRVCPDLPARQDPAVCRASQVHRDFPDNREDPDCRVRAVTVDAEMFYYAFESVVLSFFMVALCNRADHYIFILFLMAALCNRGPLYFCPVVSFYLSVFLWSPYVIGQTIIFSSCSFYLFSSCSFYLLLSFFSSPNLSGRRSDVCHTSTHGVALVRI